MPTNDEVQQALLKFLTQIYGDSGLRTDTNLVSSGLLDSLTMMDLVVFIEVEFNHRIQTEDLRAENFQTIESIAQMIQRDQSPARGVRAA